MLALRSSLYYDVHAVSGSMYMYMYMPVYVIRSYRYMYHFSFSYVVSEPYSMVPGNRNWRYRVVDIHVFVNGPSPQLQEILEGRKADDLPGLTVRINIHLLLSPIIVFTIIIIILCSLDRLTSTQD